MKALFVMKLASNTHNCEFKPIQFPWDTIFSPYKVPDYRDCSHKVTKRYNLKCY